MPQRAVNAFDRLAPDQRAAVELVARGRSYGELAGLLGISEATVRDRARGGLEALAPDLPPPARAGEVADWLLGQGGDAGELLASDAATRRWAETVAAPLRELPGAKVPALPEGGSRRAPEASEEEAVAPAATAPVTPPSPPPGAPEAPASSPGRSSRLGGFILIGVALVVVAAVLLFVLTRSDDSSPPAASAPTPTASPASTPAATANDIVLRGPAGSKAIGLMRLFKANDNTVRFALAAQGVPANTGKSTYSIWFTKKDGSSLRLGVAQNQVGKNGELTTAGPRNEDVSKFPQWFVTYDSVLVTEDSSPTASKPGKVVLSGALPHSAG